MSVRLLLEWVSGLIGMRIRTSNTPPNPLDQLPRACSSNDEDVRHFDEGSYQSEWRGHFLRCEFPGSSGILRVGSHDRF